jgi:hypothetical protein
VDARVKTKGYELQVHYEGFTTAPKDMDWQTATTITKCMGKARVQAFLRQRGFHVK